MALIANRINRISKIVEFARFILVTLRRVFVIFFVIASIYLLFIAAPKIISSIYLVLVGHVVFSGLLVHESIIKQIEAYLFFVSTNAARQSAIINISQDEIAKPFENLTYSQSYF